MTHEEFVEKYANLLVEEDFIQIQFARGNGELDDSQYVDKLIAFGVLKEDALGYIEADKALMEMFDQEGMLDDLEAITLLMVNGINDLYDFILSAKTDSIAVRSNLISEFNFSSEDADKVVAYLLKPE